MLWEPFTSIFLKKALFISSKCLLIPKYACVWAPLNELSNHTGCTWVMCYRIHTLKILHSWNAFIETALIVLYHKHSTIAVLIPSLCSTQNSQNTVTSSFKLFEEVNKNMHVTEFLSKKRSVDHKYLLEGVDITSPEPSITSCISGTPYIIPPVISYMNNLLWFYSQQLTSF